MARGDEYWLQNDALLAQRVRQIFGNRDVPLEFRAEPDETPETRVTRIVGEIRAGRRDLDDIRRSVDRLEGQVDTGGMEFPADRSFMESEEALMERIFDIFYNRNVGIGTDGPDGETARVRLRRIAGEVMAGERDLDDVRASVDRLARQGAPAPSLNDIAERHDGILFLQELLEEYDLGGLTGWAIEQLRAGRSTDEITQLLRETPEFRARFPAIDARREAGLPAISPREYLEWEQQASQIARESGLPSHFYDEPADFTDKIANNWSIGEFSARITEGFQKVDQAPEAVRREFEAIFGTSGRSAMASFFLDSDRALPALERAVATAEMGGAASMMGFNLSANRSEDLASYGFSFGAAMQAFGQAAQLRPLTDDLAFERTSVGEDVLIDSQFGLSPAAAEQITRRVEGRTNVFASGDRGAVDEDGFLGAGSV